MNPEAEAALRLLVGKPDAKAFIREFKGKGDRLDPIFGLIQSNVLVYNPTEESVQACDGVNL